ncbi:MAG: heliorhodopsin HeR [Dehalococcoidia bacterium]|nr:heliorhodopsin HeR [Dehalococcoidia bacterium]
MWSDFHRLRSYNAAMGFLHLAQAVAIFLLSNDFSLPATTSFLNFDASTRTLTPVTETVFRLPFGPLVALFLLLSAVAHFTIISPGVFGWYANNLKKGINYARWIEYSLSASLMIVLIGMLSGMYDVASLILVFVLTAVMNLCGLVMEIHNQTTEKTNWTSYAVGCIAGIAPWIAIAIYFFGSVSNGKGAVPTFVYFILPILFVFFFSFALNMFLQYKKVGPWKDYLFGERAYVLLSLVAKSALAWQVFAGTLRPM